MRMKIAHGAFLAATFLLASAMPAAAYIGPGAGLSAIGSVVGVISAVFLAIAGFVWYPVKRLLKRNKKPASGEAAAPVSEQQPTE